MATTTATQVQQLYVGLLGRAADQGGLNWWVDQITTGGRTLEDIRASFVTSTEYTNLYGGANTTRSDLVTAIYQNLFERTPSAGELNYWVSTDTRPADQLVSAFLEFASTNDQKTIANKVFVAQTYTDAVGTTNFSKAGAAAAIADVTGDSATVTTALNAINGGTLAGQVPALGLINALAAAQTAEAAFETSNKAAVDALVTKVKATASTDFSTALTNAETAADGIRDALTVTVSGNTYKADGTDTRLLNTQGQIFNEAEATALGKLTSAQKTLASSYQSAVAAEATAKAAQATDAQEAGAVNGLAADTTATTALGTLSATFGVDPNATPAVKAQAVYDAYKTGTYTSYTGTAAGLRAKIDTDLKASAYYATFKAVVVKDAALADATKATGDAADALTDTDTATSTNAADYLKALTNKTQYNEFLAKVVAADADVAAVKAIVDAYAVKTEATSAAETAITNFTATDVKVAALANVDTAGTGAAVKDVFYFAEKLTATSATPDFKIDSFAAGDSIVLGSGYTYNSGALSTGDNNKLEFFLVNSDNGVQIVLEGANYGSSEVTAATTTGIVASTNTDHAQVITLTGVTADHVAVNNGVISYV